jgi:hypothetical protein
MLTVPISMRRMGGEMTIRIANMEGPGRILSCYCTKLIRTAYLFGGNCICEDCYNEFLDHEPIDQGLHHELPRHFLSGRPARNKVSHCNECGIDISELKPATYCIQCTISYNLLSGLEKVLVTNGEEIKPVAT